MRKRTKHLPLNALQGFEAAGRHLNMRRAGEELNLTQSAISHQVRTLEEALGKPLFEANRRRLVLTREGERFLAVVKQSLEGISAAAVQVTEDKFSATLSISAAPAFLSQFLVPRLPQFLDLFPDLTLSMKPSVSGETGRFAGVDVAIVFNAAHFPGMRVDSLARLEMFPVCAPRLAINERPMQPDELRHATLIHEDNGEIWARWFAAVGAENVSPRRNIYAARTQTALTLANAGVGYAIHDAFLGSRPGAAYTLIRPFGNLSFAFGEYSMVSPLPERATAATLAFTEWVRREVAETNRQTHR